METFFKKSESIAMAAYFKNRLRLISLLTLLCFGAQDIVHAAPGGAAGPAPVPGVAATPLPINSFVTRPGQLNLPLDAVTLQEVHVGTNGKLIIHIQDAHANLSGQESLAKALDHLLTQYDLKLVLVEGSARNSSLDQIRRLAPLKEWKIIARRFLYEGIISGEEYLNLTTEHPMKIIGVEYRDLYDESVKAYAALVDRRKDILHYLYQSKVSLERLKSKFYPQELKDYERAKGNDEDSVGGGAGNGIDFKSGVSRLFKLAEDAEYPLADLPQVTKLKSLLDKEQSIDFAQANAEQSRILESLRAGGAGEEVQAFLETSKRLKTSQVSQYRLLKQLLSSAENKQIALESFPEVKAYAAYLSEFLDLQLDELLQEMELLEDKVYEKLLPGSDARKVRAIDRFLGLLGNAYKLQMSSQDFGMFTFNEKDFPTESWLAFMNKKLSELGFFESLVPYESYLEEARNDFGKFYELVGERDQAFLDNAKRIMTEEKTDAAILIAGGYHTAHLTQLLRAEGTSYLVLTPSVTDTTDHERYENILLSNLRQQEKHLARTKAKDSSAYNAQNVAQTRIPRGLRALDTVSGLRLANLSTNLKDFADKHGGSSASLSEAMALAGTRLAAQNPERKSKADSRDASGARLAKKRDAVRVEREARFRSRFASMQQTAAQKLRFSYRILDADHPTVVFARSQLDRIIRKTPAKLFIVDDEEPNAFAIGGVGEIYVTTGMLKYIASEEELLALLMHELTHVEKEHSFRSHLLDPSDLHTLGLERIFEFEADSAMMLELDKRGVNPIGAIEFSKTMSRVADEARQKMRGQKFHESDNMRRMLAELAVADPTHGSAVSRLMNLREIIRFIDFHHLKQETTPVDWQALQISTTQPKPLSKQEIKKIHTLAPTEFWTAYGRLLIDHSKTIWKHPIRDKAVLQFAKEQKLDLSGAEEDLLLAILHFVVLKSKANYTITRDGKKLLLSKDNYFEVFGLEDVLGLFEKGAFDAIGLSLSESDLLAIADAAALNTFRSEPVEVSDQVIARIHRLRSQTVAYHDSHYGSSMEFVPRFDTRLLSGFMLANSVRGQADFEIEVETDISPITQRPEKIKVLNYKKPLPFVEINKDVLERFLSKAEINLVDLNAVTGDIYEALGLASQMDMPNPQHYRLNDRNFIGFKLMLARMMKVTIGHMQGLEESEQLDPLRRIQRYHFTLGRSIYSASDERANGDHRDALRVGPRANGALEFFSAQLITAETLSPAFSVYNRLRKEIFGDGVLFRELIPEFFSYMMAFADGERLFADTMKTLRNTDFDLDRAQGWSLRGAANETALHNRLLLDLYATFYSKEQFMRRVEYVIGRGVFKISSSQLFIQWVREMIDQKNKIHAGANWTFDARDAGRLKRLVAAIKLDALGRMANPSVSATKVMDESVKLVKKWGIAFVSVDRRKYEMFWNLISKKVIAYLESQPDFPQQAEDFEKLMALSLLSQDSFSGMSLATVSFREMIRRTSTFEEAFALFREYNFLPRTLVLEGLFVLMEEKARSPRELRELADWFLKEADRFADYAGDAMSAEAAQTLISMISTNERSTFFKHLISTNESDEGLKKFMADKWWKIFNSYTVGKSNIRDLALLAYYGERDPDSPVGREKLTMAEHQAAEEVQFLNVGAVQVPSFSEFYPSLFRLDSIVIYLLLRSITLDGSDALFRSPAAKMDLVSHFIEHYLRLEQTEMSDRVVRQLKQTISDNLDPEDLFYFLGPALAQVALQVPTQPYSTDHIVDALTDQYLKELEKNGFPGIRDPQKFTRTQALIKTRMRAFVMGTRPKLEGIKSGGELNAIFPQEVAYTSLENAALERLAPMITQRKVFSEKVTPIELSVEMSKRIGGLAVRLLQLSGMYFDLSPEDRKALSDVYDAVRGQSKLQAFLLMERIADENTRFKATFFDQIQKIDEMLGGGSIVTVFGVEDADGERAYGLTNPNAAYRSEELRLFAHQILDGLIQASGDENLPEIKYYRLLKLLLDDAHQWLLNEIEDPEYFAKNQAFTRQNDHASAEPSRFTPTNGIKSRFYVPDVRDTGTEKIRSQRLVRGESMNAFLTHLDSAATPEMRLRAKDAVSLIAQNYLYQILEAGLVHSDIHPGQFLLADNDLVAVLDTKNILKLSDAERTLLLQLLTLGIAGEREEMFKLAASAFMTEQQREDPDLIARVRGEFFGALDVKNAEMSLGNIFFNLKGQGVDVPLKWLLVIKNFMGLNRMAKMAGFDNFMQAFVYERGEETTEVTLGRVFTTAAHVAPKASIRLGDLLGNTTPAGIELTRILTGARLSEAAPHVESKDQKVDPELTVGRRLTQWQTPHRLMAPSDSFPNQQVAQAGLPEASQVFVADVIEEAAKVSSLLGARLTLEVSDIEYVERTVEKSSTRQATNESLLQELEEALRTAWEGIRSFLDSALPPITYVFDYADVAADPELQTQVLAKLKQLGEGTEVLFVRPTGTAVSEEFTLQYQNAFKAAPTVVSDGDLEAIAFKNPNRMFVLAVDFDRVDEIHQTMSSKTQLAQFVRSPIRPSTSPEMAANLLGAALRGVVLAGIKFNHPDQKDALSALNESASGTMAGVLGGRGKRLAPLLYSLQEMPMNPEEYRKSLEGLALEPLKRLSGIVNSLVRMTQLIASAA